MKETGIRLMCFEGGRSHKPRNTGGLQKLRKPRKQILPQNLQMEPCLYTLILVWGLQNFKRINFYYFKLLSVQSFVTATQETNASWVSRFDSVQVTCFDLQSRRGKSFQRLVRAGTRGSWYSKGHRKRGRIFPKEGLIQTKSKHKTTP